MQIRCFPLFMQSSTLYFCIIVIMTSMKLASFKLKRPIARNKITVRCSNDLKLRKSDEHLKEEMDLCPLKGL